MILRRTAGMLKRSPIKKVGPVTTAWRKFRNEKFERDAGKDGLIRCQAEMVDQSECSVLSPNPDLHHIEGRAARPDLYYEEKNLVWLCRMHHQLVHENPNDYR